MPLNASPDKLLEVMANWANSNTVKAAVVLVDETTGDPNKSQDRDTQHHAQSTVIRLAAKLGMPIFVVRFGAKAEHGRKTAFDGGLGPELDSAIPGSTFYYDKYLDETDGFANDALKKDAKSAGITDVIIMGQSVNACCMNTARGAHALGLRVHTCGLVVRGGGSETKPPDHQWGFGWPDGTTVYQSL